MKPLRVGCVLIAAAVALVPSLSAAGVRIELKNGSEISADECHESDGRLLCYRTGGTFEIEKQDIASVKHTKGESTYEEEKPATGQEDAGKGSGRNGKETISKNPEAEGKAGLDRITQRKRELQPAREKLLSDREKISEDLKNAPDWMTVDRFEALQKRISELDERIKVFNDEVIQLNQEEKTILESLKKKSPGAP